MLTVPTGSWRGRGSGTAAPPAPPEHGAAAQCWQQTRERGRFVRKQSFDVFYQHEAAVGGRRSAGSPQPPQIGHRGGVCGAAGAGSWGHGGPYGHGQDGGTLTEPRAESKPRASNVTHARGSLGLAPRCFPLPKLCTPPPPVSAHGWQREAVNSSESLAFTRCVLIKANSIDPTQPRGGCSVLRTPGAATSPSQRAMPKRQGQARGQGTGGEGRTSLGAAPPGASTGCSPLFPALGRGTKKKIKLDHSKKEWPR